MTHDELKQIIREAQPGMAGLSPELREDALLREGTIYMGKRMSWCTGCGEEFETADLWNSGRKYAVCPHCGKRRKLIKSPLKSVMNCEYLYTKLEVHRGVQVVRNFQVKKYLRRKNTLCGVEIEAPIRNIGITEVSQIWMADNGLTEIYARRSYYVMGAYTYSWGLDTPMDFRRCTRSNGSYLWTGFLAPGWKVLKELRRRGLTGKPDEGCNLYYLCHDILTDPKVEIMIKAHQKALVKAYEMYSHREGGIVHFWDSIRVAMRHGYKVKDAGLYLDYLSDLETLGMDLRSPKYLCPENLRAAHAGTQRRIARAREQEERKRQEEMMMKDREAIAKYEERMKAYAGVALCSGRIRIEALLTVAQVRAEGDAMHHCIFHNKYYKKSDSLLMSAKVNGKRAETIEFSLSSGMVLQSRAVNNGRSEWHNDILALVEKNAALLQRTARAHA